MIKPGIGYAIIFCCLILVPVIRLKNLHVPCKLPIGPRTIARVDQVIIMLVGTGSSWASQ